MSVLARTTVLLILSNIFMTFAWYAHLRNLSDRKWWVTTLSVFVPFAILYMRQPGAAGLPVGRTMPPRRRLFHLPLRSLHAVSGR